MSQKKNIKKKLLNLSKKQIVLAICIALMSVITVGSTMALLSAATDSVNNTFKRADISCNVVENFDGNVKSNVKVENNSQNGISGFIRAAIIVSWQDNNGNVYSKQPVAGTDYNIVYGTEWIGRDDGYYYWHSPVAKDDSTGNLIVSCSEIDGKAPEGYTLVVDIVAEIIQSNPTTAAQEAWGYVPGGTGGVQP